MQRFVGIFLCLFSLVHAKEKLVIGKIQSADLPKREVRYLQKLTIQVGARQKKYSLVLKDRSNTIKADFFRLSLKIVKDQGRYTILASIIALEDNKPIKKVYARDVRRQKVLVQSELALYALFGLRPQYQDEIDEEAISTNKLAERKLKEVEDRLARNSRNAKPITDFNKRIKRLKRAADKRVVEVKKDVINETAETSSNKKIIRKKKQAKVKSVSPKAGIEKSPLRQTSGKSLKLVYNYMLEGSYAISQINNLDSRNGFVVADFNTDINYLSLKAHVTVLHPKFQKNLLNFSLSYSSSLSSTNFDLQALWDVDTNIDYQVDILGRTSRLGVGIKTHTYQYAGLESVGAGAKRSQSKLIFMYIGYTTSFFNKLLFYELDAGLSPIGIDQSEDNKTALDGIFGINIQTKFYYKNPFYFKNSYFTSDFNYSSFSSEKSVDVTELKFSFGLAKFF